ncbi:MAG: hypothetical protein Kow0077_30170 [Anaerolineae bacterium]
MDGSRIPLPPPRHLFTLAETPVQADASAPLNVAGVFGLCLWIVMARYPTLPRIAQGVLAVIWALLMMLVFAIHSLGHIFSARAVGAPMDALVINAVHWITLYANDQVPPRAHLGRAVGGPAANLAAIGASVFFRRVVPPGPFGRDLVDVFAMFNAAICAAALLPTPSFDGGSLVKWAVYERTGDLEHATRVRREAGMTAASSLAGLAALALMFQRRIAGVLLAAFSLVTALESFRKD